MMPAYKLRELIREKEEELFRKQYTASSYEDLKEIDKLEEEIKLLKRTYWELV